MQKVKLGVIGCGVIGRRHLQAAAQSPVVDLAAIADLREEVAKQAAEEFHVSKVFNDGEALIADGEVDAVVLAMPTGVRTPLALTALKAGKHVLLEKPAAMNVGELEAMEKIRGDRVVAVCSMRYRYTDSARAVTAYLSENPLGPIRLVRCRGVRAGGEPPAKAPPPWRLKRSLNGGGILVNWGVYDLDYLLGLLGWKLRPKVVLAQTWTIPKAFRDRAAPDSDAETHVTALIRCEDGAAISFERGEFMPTAGEDAWQIIGDRGALRLTMLARAGKQLLHDQADKQQGVVTRTLWSGDEIGADLHAGPIGDFAEAIIHRRPPLTSLENAMVIQKITDAIYASAGSGKAVEIK